MSLMSVAQIRRYNTLDCHVAGYDTKLSLLFVPLTNSFQPEAGNPRKITFRLCFPSKRVQEDK